MKRTDLRRWVGLLLAAALVGCRPVWEISLAGPLGEATLDQGALEALSAFAVESQGKTALPLERVLVEQGYALVDDIAVVDGEGREVRYPWAAVAEGAYVFTRGTVQIGEEQVRPASIVVVPSARLGSPPLPIACCSSFSTDSATCATLRLWLRG